MIYTDLTKKALKLAYKAHDGQLDKSGIPYIFHPYHLAEQMDDEVSVCAALLHDVVEDTDITLEMLKAEGFNDDIIEILKLLTHDEKDSYNDYIKKIASNKTAVKIKLADLSHNSDFTRLDKLDAKSEKRCEKYQNAIKYLLTFR